MTGYYDENLSGKRLERCYDIASGRVRQYLEAEITHVLDRLRPTDTVIELGCGYGRIAWRLAEIAHRVVGIDTATQSLELAKQQNHGEIKCDFQSMDALDLHFPDNSFDTVVCLQNGICAFGADPASLLKEALRVTREGGIVILSSYSDRFWQHRLGWFEAQATEGLVGEIDLEASGDGVIVCHDGFSAGRFTPENFRTLCLSLGIKSKITEVDQSSVFCEVTKDAPK